MLPIVAGMNTATDDTNGSDTGSGRPADSNPFEQGTEDPTGVGTVETPGVDGGRPDGDPEAASDSDREDRLGGGDPVKAARESKQTVTNDAVAGETVFEGAGDGNYGPTGGSPREAEPIGDNELGDQNVDLGTDLRDTNER